MQAPCLLHQSRTHVLTVPSQVKPAIMHEQFHGVQIGAFAPLLDSPQCAIKLVLGSMEASAPAGVDGQDVYLMDSLDSAVKFLSVSHWALEMKAASQELVQKFKAAAV